ncbi:peptidoglycan DD-metalloendopeptidase family protein [Alterluteimonas muca]|uniref:M23 family metallopeptidase n=1 Tax=Alterluteimonas muca TaxID=2878684 RepID=UPI003F49E101
MTLNSYTRQARARMMHWLRCTRARIARRPMTAAAVLACSGLVLGAGAAAGEISRLKAENTRQQALIDNTRQEAQREVNALAARLGELQAQANRLNALGERLTRIGKLGEGEFDFTTAVAVGGPGPVQDMPARALHEGMEQVDTQFRTSGDQLSVLEALLLGEEMERAALPSRSPVGSSYVTSSYGYRADPFSGGRAFHRGIDFSARLGDPVMAVADGVVSYSGQRSGYGNVVEVDHGNGYVTRYAHNSRNTARVGDLVRAGTELAKAGSTGRSTGVHVHFEVWEGGRVLNPRQFLADMGVSRQ